MSRAAQAANIARHDAIHARIQRELGSNVRVVVTRTATGPIWCELKLPLSRYTVSWVCCPGDSREKALTNAIKAALRKVREA